MLYKADDQNKLVRRQGTLLVFVVVLLMLVLFDNIPEFKVRAESNTPWYSSSWGFRKQITIDHTKVSGGADLTNFPMLFSVTDTDLKYTGSGGKVGKTDGTDMLFTSSNGTTKLSHEIEKYVSATGETVAWVKIPTLSASADTVIYIYFGNAAAADQQDKTNVWDSNYKGVWHLKEDPSITCSGTKEYCDSTSNGNNGDAINMEAGDQITGQIGGSINIDGVNEYVNINNTVGNWGTGDFTVSVWFRTSVTSQQHNLVGKRDTCNNSFSFWNMGTVQSPPTDTGAGIMEMGAGGDVNYNNVQGTKNLINNTFHYIVTLRTGTTAKVYVDGIGEGSETGYGQNISNSANLQIGNNTCGTAAGIIDEVRVSNSVRTAGWIGTEYNNQSSPSGFYAYGTEESIVSGTIPTLPTVSGLRGYYSKGSWDVSELKTAVNEEVNFPLAGPNNFNSILQSRLGQISNVVVPWYGAIYVSPENAGPHKFMFDVNSNEGSWLVVDQTMLWAWQSGDQVKAGVNLSAGWHNFLLFYYTTSGQTDAQAQLYWKHPGDASWEIIPASAMSPQIWPGADDIITIPDLTSPKEHLDYLTAGVNTESSKISQIKMTLPGNVILKNNVWLTWMSDETATIRVRNIATGQSQDISGTRMTTIPGIPLSFLYAKVPNVLIPNSGQELNFSFEAIGGKFKNAGVAIIVPYIDPSHPLGRLSIRSSGFVYYSMSQAMVFPIAGTVNADIRPIFIFSDGETKMTATEVPPTYRPNYLEMLSGTGDPPSEFAILQDIGGHKIVPQSGPLNLNNPATWYPTYGREGTGFDVISPNYVINQWSGAESGGGQIPSITVPANHTWIAFQYYSTNFAEDGVNGSPESTLVLAGGLFSEKDILSEDLLSSPDSGPLATLSANPSSILSGGSSTLTWSSTNATACIGTNFNTNGATSGSISVRPTVNTTYSILCDGASASVTVSVQRKPFFKEN